MKIKALKVIVVTIMLIAMSSCVFASSGGKTLPDGFYKTVDKEMVEQGIRGFIIDGDDFIMIPSASAYSSKIEVVEYTCDGENIIFVGQGEIDATCKYKNGSIWFTESGKDWEFMKVK